MGGGRLGVDHRMDQPDFVARHRERPALGQRLKEILVVGASREGKSRARLKSVAGVRVDLGYSCAPHASTRDRPLRTNQGAP